MLGNRVHELEKGDVPWHRCTLRFITQLPCRDAASEHLSRYGDMCRSDATDDERPRPQLTAFRESVPNGRHGWA